MDSLEVDAPVKVEWKESGSQFSGVVKAVNEDGTYDVLYDEKVDGKACLEKQVMPDRIGPAWMEVQTNGNEEEQQMRGLDENIETDYWTESNVESYKSTTDRNKLVSRLLQVTKNSSSDEAADPQAVEALDNHEVVHLHDALTPFKAMELATYNASSVGTIVSLLTAGINTNCSESHAQASYAELWAEYVDEAHGKPKVSEWLAGLTSSEESALSGTVALHSALAAVLRLQAALNTSQVVEDRSFSMHARPVSVAASVNIAEETIDRAMGGVRAFLDVNFLGLLAGESKQPGSGRQGKAKARADINNKAIADVAKIVFPTITSVLSALEQCFRSGRQSERLGLSAADLALAALRTDPVTAPALEALSGSTAGVLVSLHRAACALLREVFASQTSHRKGLLSELLAQLSQTFAVKAPYRSYPLSGDASAATGEGVRYASMSVVALLGCLQSAVSAAESLTLKKSKSSKSTESPSMAASTTSNSTSGGSGGKSKGKRGSKDHKTDIAEAQQAEHHSESASTVHTHENAKKSIVQSYILCSHFAAELFQRCTNKEVSGDYRNLAGCLVTELLALLQQPAWPAASVLLEQVLHNIFRQLNTADSAETTNKKDKDATFSPFLLDLLGSTTTGLRALLVTSEREHRAAQDCVLSSAVASSVSKKIAALRPVWEASAGALASTKKGAKNRSSANISASTMEVSAALEALLEVTSSTIDAVAESPLYLAANLDEDEEGGGDGSGSGAASDIASLPPPLDILKALPEHADLARLFPDLSPVDLQYHHVCTYLLHSLSPATTAGSSTSTAGSSSGGAAQDALESLLCSWYLAACTEGRPDVATYLYSRLEAFAAYKSTIRGGGGGGGSQKKTMFTLHTHHTTSTSTASAWASTTATQPTASRANFSVEAILAANRALLAARFAQVMFKNALNALLNLTLNPVPAVRAKAVKMITALLKCDPDLIQDEHVRLAVTATLNDRAISVREEGVKLIGSFVVKGYKNLAAPYLEGLKAALHDEGISVRKSVVGLFKEILLHQADHPQYTELCLSLLEKASHPKEEESIKESIRTTFQQIWFSPPSSAVVQAQMQLQAQGVTRLKRHNSTGSVDSAGGYGGGTSGLRSALSSTHSLSQSFSALNGNDGAACGTPGSLSVPALSRASSCYSVDSATDSVAGARENGTENWVSPLSQCSPRGAATSAGQVLTFSSPADGPLTIDIDATDAEGRPVVSMASRTPGHTPGGASVRTPNTANSAYSHASAASLTPKEALRDHIRATALQLVELAATDTHTDTVGRWMVSLLKEVLHGSSEGDEGSAQLAKRRHTSSLYCAKIIACLAEELIRVEEERGFLQQQAERGQCKEPSAQCTNIIRAVALFCTAHPPFISKHLSTLRPYLKQDTNYSKEQNAFIKLKVTQIVTATTSIDSSAFTFNLQELAHDLKTCALSLGADNVRAAAGCLALLAENVTKDAAPLFKLADQCFRSIRGIATAVPDSAQLHPGQLGNLQRCLLVLGYVCESARKCPGAMETFADSFNSTSMELRGLPAAARAVYLATDANQSIAKRDISAVELLHPSALQGACYAAAIYALTVPHPAVQKAGAQALCGVFAGCPRLMMLAQQEGLLSALLGENYDDAVHEKFICSITEMMELEETRLEQQQNLRLMKDSGVAVVETDVVMGNQELDAESTIPGFALQQHLRELQAFLSHPSPALRHTTLRLVGTLLRQGMLCPIEVVASLIALQCDADPAIRQEALRILQIEDEKHPTFVSARMVDGIEAAHAHQLRTQGVASTLEQRAEGTAHRNKQQPVSLQGEFFSSCVTHPRRRKELLDGLLHRAHRMLTKHREELAQHSASYDLVLQALAAEQKLLKEEQQSALMATTVTNPDGASASTSGGAQAVSPLKRSASFPSSSSSSATKKSNTSGQLHLDKALTAYSKAGAADFIASTLAYLPYDAVEEPLQVVYYINRNVPVSTELLLQRLSKQLLCVGAERRKGGAMQPPVLGTKPRASGPGKSGIASVTSPATSAPRPFLDNNGPLEGDADLLVTDKAFFAWLESTLAEKKSPSSPSTVVVRLCELLVLALELRCSEAVLRLKAFLKLAYGLSDDRCAAFNPDERSLSLSAAAAAAAASNGNSADKLSMANASLDFQPHPPTVDTIEAIISVQQFTAFATQTAKFCNDKGADKGRAALLALVKQVAMDFNRVTLLINSDPEDFTLTAASTQAGVAAKRKRRPAATPAEGEKKTPGRKPKAKATPVKKKPAAKKARYAVNFNDEDDGSEDEGDASGDEDWEG